MQSRRPTVSTLLLPHPPLPRRRSSMLSVDSASSQPRTPRSGLSPNPSQVFFSPSRKSTDSWNSSNADEVEYEWKPDQILLLSRTLDALPAHLVTPFNGPIPPPNLLDKIARGISKAKGPEDWPHSLRATRVKLIELARSKGKREDQRRQDTITEEPEVEIEDGSNYSYMYDAAERPLSSARRKLGRQSSMDFIDTAGKDIKNNPDIARLSRRLQRTDRTFHHPSFHPYSCGARVNRRSCSPPPLANVPSLISPSSESSDTLNTISSFSSEPRRPRRSTSSMSSISMHSEASSSIALPDPRVQRIRLSDVGTPLGGPNVPQPCGLKRAPSYGAVAQEARRELKATAATPMQGRHERRDSGSYPSSDEEEKARSRNAKKAKVKLGSKSSTPSPKAKRAPSPPPLPEKDKRPPASARPVHDENIQLLQSPPLLAFKFKKTAKVEGSAVPTKTSSKRPPAMNLQRNPSIFGPELSHVQKKSSTALNAKMTISTPPPSSPTKPRGRGAPTGILTPTRVRSPSPPPLSPASALACALSPAAHFVAPMSPASPLSPVQSQTKTLRRVKRLVPARRISFGSLLTTSDDMDLGNEVEGGRSCLGSAFQLL